MVYITIAIFYIHNMKATKKPVEIEYFPCEKIYKHKILEWSTPERPIIILDDNLYSFTIEIKTLEWTHLWTTRDVIIKWVEWEVYPCKKDIFEKTYNIILIIWNHTQFKNVKSI